MNPATKEIEVLCKKVGEYFAIAIKKFVEENGKDSIKTIEWFKPIEQRLKER